MTVPIDLKALAHALDGEVSGSQVLAPGPGHSSRDRSLSVKPTNGTPDGFVAYSFAGDAPIVCRDYVRIRLGQQRPKPNGAAPATKRPSEAGRTGHSPKGAGLSVRGSKNIVATYDYTDADGKLLYQVVRYEPKDFRYRRPDGNGGWVWRMGDRRVLYRLRELLDHADATVFITEGEKDADRVAKLGHCATTVASSKWAGVSVQALAGRDLIILQDNDRPGKEKAQEAAKRLHGIAKSVRVVRLPDLPERGDISDWLDCDGRRAEKLVEVCLAAPQWKPDQSERQSSKSEPAKGGDPLINFVFAGDNKPTPQRMLIEGVMPLEGLPFIGGQSSAGKTFVATLLAACAATGRTFFGREVKERVGTVIIAAEGRAMLNARIAAALADLGISEKTPIAWVKQVPDFNTREGLAKLVRELRAISEHYQATFGVRLGLVFVDTVSASFDIKEEADNAEAARVCKVMRRIGDATDAIVVPIHHYGKNAGVGLRGASAWRANADFVLSVMADIDPQTGNVSNRQLAVAKDRDGSQGPLTPFTLKWVELGIDDSGKPWGSMVAVADENTTKPASHWPPSLSVFRQALLNALTDSGFEDQPFPDGPRSRVVDVERVKAEFAKVCHVDSETEAGRQEARRKQFARKLGDAQQRKLVGVHANPSRTLVWLVDIERRG